MMPSMTSSAPPAMEVSLISLNNLKSARYYNSPNPDLYILLTRTSLVKPIPPQNCRQESLTSLFSRPHFNLHMEASCVTSLHYIILLHIEVTKKIAYSPAIYLSVAL